MSWPRLCTILTQVYFFSGAFYIDLLCKGNTHTVVLRGKYTSSCDSTKAWPRMRQMWSLRHKLEGDKETRSYKSGICTCTTGELGAPGTKKADSCSPWEPFHGRSGIWRMLLSRFQALIIACLILDEALYHATLGMHPLSGQWCLFIFADGGGHLDYDYVSPGGGGHIQLLEAEHLQCVPGLTPA